MIRIPKFVFVPFVLALASNPIAQAEGGPDIKVGAHAFFDFENVDVNDVNRVDGTNLRLLRIDVGGKFKDMTFTSTTDVQGDDITIQDLFVEFAGTTKLRVGNFKLMNGLEQESSLYATTFAEGNSVTKVNGLGRMLGVAAYRSFDTLHVSGGVFSANANSTGASDEWALSGRLAKTFEPGDGNGLIQLGASARYRENSDGSLYGYGQKPFTKSAPSTVKVSNLADSDLFIGLEGVYLNKGLSLQSEFGRTKADCVATVCTGNPTFQAWYLDASYIWGGERVLKNGLFKRTKVASPASDGGMGAFQIAARYDVADLNDGPVMGGKQESLVIGATWYRDQYIRVLGNYIHSEFDNSPAYGNGSADALVLRLQAELY